MSVVWISLGILCAVGLIALFPTTKQRLIGAGLMVPLAALAFIIQSVGEQPREESTTAQSSPSSFSSEARDTAGPRPAALSNQNSKQPAATHPDISVSLAGPKSLKHVVWPDPGVEYTSTTLWNRIDGGAEMYTKAGMRRAFFATARVANTDIEVQVFDFITKAKATIFFDSVSRAPDSVPFPAGDKAVRWKGGGELCRGRYYARLILSTAEPSPAAIETVENLLTRIAEPAPEHPNESLTEPGKASTAIDAQRVKDDESQILAETAGVTPDELKRFQIRRIETVQRSTVEVEIITAENQWLAAAWALSLVDNSGPDSTTVEGMAQETYVRAQGNCVYRGHDKNAVIEIAKSRERASLPGLESLRRHVQSVEIQLGGWNGQRALGPTLFGTLENDTDVFISYPESIDAAWTNLLEHYSVSDPSTRQVEVQDEYQGPVYLLRGETAVIGVIAYDEKSSAERLGNDLLAHL